MYIQNNVVIITAVMCQDNGIVAETCLKIPKLKSVHVVLLYTLIHASNKNRNHSVFVRQVTI